MLAALTVDSNLILLTWRDGYRPDRGRMCSGMIAEANVHEALCTFASRLPLHLPRLLLISHYSLWIGREGAYGECSVERWRYQASDE